MISIPPSSREREMFSFPGSLMTRWFFQFGLSLFKLINHNHDINVTSQSAKCTRKSPTIVCRGLENVTRPPLVVVSFIAMEGSTRKTYSSSCFSNGLLHFPHSILERKSTRHEIHWVSSYDFTSMIFTWMLASIIRCRRAWMRRMYSSISRSPGHCL